VKRIFVLTLLLSSTLYPVEFMPVSEIKPGMKGKGKTVFIGTEVSEFDVEILGVMENYFPKRDIILAKLSGGPLKKTGVISGMSGSPVYINGKLIGAISYRFGSFQKEPMAGITPISEMLDIIEEEGTEKPMNYGNRPLKFIETPLMISGFEEEVFNTIAADFEKFGFLPVSGGSVTKNDSISVDLQPGSAVGVGLITGDASISAIGTLTYIEGKKMLAFGHRFLHQGKVNLPLTTVYTHSVIPSSYSSFKMSSVMDVVGKVEADRITGISGELDALPELIPFSLKINEEEYDYKVAKNKFLTSSLIGYATGSAIYSLLKLYGDFTIVSDLTVFIKGEKSLHLKNFFSSDVALFQTQNSIVRPISRLLNNEFKEANIEKVILRLSATEEKATASIENVKLNKDRFNPGDTINIKLFLKSDRNELDEKSISWKIPEGIKYDQLKIIISSGDSLTLLEQKHFPHRFKPRNFEHLLEILQDQGANNEIGIEIIAKGEGISIDGYDLPSLPPSFQKILKSTRLTGRINTTQVCSIFRKRIETEYSISGSHTLDVTVKQKKKLKKESK